VGTEAVMWLRWFCATCCRWR